MEDRLSVEHVTTTDRVVDALRAALLAGDLAPGTPLREVALAARLGVARSTVREALTQLVGEGLATRIAHRGVAVAHLTAADLRDLTRARLALEEAGVRAYPQAPAARRSALDDALTTYGRAARGSDLATLTAAHLAVHAAIAGLADSPRLDAVTDALHGELRLALAGADRRRGNAARQVAAHRELAQLVRTAPPSTAVAALRAHLEAAETSLLEDLVLPPASAGGPDVAG